MFVEGNAREPEKIILEVVQIPRDGLAVETGDRIANVVIQIAPGFHLEARQHRDHFAISVRYGRSDGLRAAIRREELKECGVSQVFFEISAVAQIFTIDFRNGQAMFSKMPGEFQEGGVLFTHAIQNADRAVAFVGKANDFAA